MLSSSIFRILEIKILIEIRIIVETLLNQETSYYFLKLMADSYRTRRKELTIEMDLALDDVCHVCVKSTFSRRMTQM